MADSMDIDIDLGDEPDMTQYYEAPAIDQVRADATAAGTSLTAGEDRTTHGD